MSSIRYRPDIDGLRAIAVLMVVIFHAGINLFDGGFIGVDIFFVISGFLITSLIVKDIQAGNFSMLEFWERRIRRILPALAVVVAATLAVGAILFLPNDFVGLARQVIWQAFMASNVYFYTQKGYFNTEHELEPLLHTWSLAVEEQFYLVFPVLLFLLWRFYQKHLVWLLFGIFGLSLAASIISLRVNPDQAFFLLPYRAWELLMGAMLAIYLPYARSFAKPLPDIAAGAGLLMIFAAGIFYNSKMSFPGFAALLPCVGTCLLIWSGALQSTVVSRALSIKPVVFIGLVSYSWYLWHWPIFSFGEYVLQSEFGKLEKLFCIALSFLLSVLSWKFIETPFRKKKGVVESGKPVFITALAIQLFVVTIAFTVVWNKGFSGRFSEEALVYAQGAVDKSPLTKPCQPGKYDRVIRNDICQTNPESGNAPSFILWGDSQADAAAPAFITLSKKYHVNGYMAFKHDCPPILDIRYKRDGYARPSCVDYNKAHYDFIKRNKIKRVYLVATWSNWAKNKDLYFDEKDWFSDYESRYENIIMAGVQRTVDDLQKMGIKVYFLIDGPTLDFEPPRLLALENQMGIKESRAFIPVDSYLKKRSQNIDNFIKQNQGTNLIVADMLPILCKDGKCISDIGGRSLYFDHNHFSTYGANYLASVFEPFFQDIAE